MKRKIIKPNSEASVDALQKAILDLHDCKATWVKSVPIKEIFEGETLWEGAVQVFTVDHPKSRFCYAWSHGLEGSKKRRFFAVLHQGPIDSPKKAIRASIVYSQRTKEN